MFVLVASVVFVVSSAQLGELCLALSPVALGIVFWYSLAKRVTSYTQAYLGLAMAVAPVGGWIAAGGPATAEPVWLGLAIGTWVAGFDVLYACQDLEFDRREGLKSIPVRFGIRRALTISRALHVVTILALAMVGGYAGLNGIYVIGVLAGRRAAHLGAVARPRGRSLAGQARVRRERLGGHPVSGDDRGRGLLGMSA